MTDAIKPLIGFNGGRVVCILRIMIADELQDIMETWRLRTPNEWDDFKIWSDVLMWRNQIYSIVVNAFKDMSDTNPQLYQLGYRDKAWNVNKWVFLISFWHCLHL